MLSSILRLTKLEWADGMIRKSKPNLLTKEMVWTLVLLIGTKDPKFGKWSPKWEGQYKVSRCVPGNAYILETLEGEEFFSTLNGKYLKKYYPSVWVDA